METWHIHIEGQVQGVGFRPFVYKLARQNGLTGWVNNTLDGVHIEFNAGEAEARAFLWQVLDQAPRLARIIEYQLRMVEGRSYADFHIVHSEAQGTASLLLSPDFALCDDCRRELYDSRDRRYRYPFTTCTNCGPRFSITRRLPYDRALTTMEAFRMCPACAAEYQDPADRRYFSQTNSCPACAVSMAIPPEGLHEQEAILARIVAAWRAGLIVAIKGIGGYLLTCDAARADVIGVLRRRKHRPSKPFALMYPDLSTLEAEVRLRDRERAELTGVHAPIVLLALKDRKTTSLAVDAIAPGLQRVGVMLPYTPLYELLLREFGGPIVATSGNPSGSPIVFRDGQEREGLEGIADLVVTNDREIVIPQDDSVVQFAPRSGRRVILRRSRGLAPTFIQPKVAWPATTVLATGAMLKSTFSLLHRGNVYISQYLGDLEQFDAQQHYRLTVDHFLRVLRSEPRRILVDAHPAYPSTELGRALGEDLGVEVQPVQHHVAHLGALLGEHALLDAEEPLLGVVWDGTGLGDDGQIWGGEFFDFRQRQVRRIGHFGYFPSILGDKMPREPRISALSATFGLPYAEELLRGRFSATEWNVYTRMLQKEGGLRTSSVGRLFDAVAALVGLSDKQSFEGEAAMHLEAMGRQYLGRHGISGLEAYPLSDDMGPTGAILGGVLEDLKRKTPAEAIAARFHLTLAEVIRRAARAGGYRRIGFSGGVFQNTLLVDLLEWLLGQEYALFFHRELSPNDENVSFGQLIAAEFFMFAR